MKTNERQIIEIRQIFKILRDLLGLKGGFFQVLVVLYILGLKIFHNRIFKPPSSMIFYFFCTLAPCLHAMSFIQSQR